MTNEPIYSPKLALNDLCAMLGGTHAEAIYEWIIITAKSEHIIPSEFTPALLAIGDNIESMRPYIVQIIGQPQSEARQWVTTIAKDLSGCLSEIHVQECENDAFMIGAISYAIPFNEYLKNKRGMYDTQFMYPFYDLPNLYKYKASWSLPLTETFMLANFHQNYIGTESTQFAYRLSSSVKSSRLQAWQNVIYKQLENYTSIREVISKTMTIFQYLQQLLKALNS